MFRSSNRRDSEHSDEESKLPLRPDNDDGEPQKKKRNNVWTDVLTEQTLESCGSRVNLNKESNLKIKRGAESYDIPKNHDHDHRKEESDDKTVEIPILVTPANDDPFGETTDLSAVEQFGVAGPSTYSGGYRGRGRGRGRGGAPRHQAGRESSYSNDFRRGGAQRFGMKRNWYGKSANVPLNKEYSLEGLMSTEFQAELPLDELGKEIALALGEQDPSTIIKIVMAIGEERSLAIFEETRQVESSGGMKVLDGTRRRTPGGVFIMLMKSDMDIAPEVKDAIFEQSKQQQKKIAKAKRRNNKNFGDSLDEISSLLKKEKEAEKESESLKKLDDVSNVLVTAKEEEEEGKEVLDTEVMES